jgi:hypothetical protein
MPVALRFPVRCPAAMLGLRIGLITSLIPLLLAPPTQAAEQLVITYGPLSAGLSIQDLTTLVDTNEVSNSLKFYLDLASLDPSLLKSVLAMELGASSQFMAGMLTSESGERLLHEISQVIHLPPARPEIQVLKSAEVQPSTNSPNSSPNSNAQSSNTQNSNAQNIAALRTALVEAANDRQVTVLEVLQHYPTQKVYVDVAKLLRFARSLETLPTP